MKIRISNAHTSLWLLLLAGLVLAGCTPKQKALDDSFAFPQYVEPEPGPDRANMSPGERFAYDYRSPAVARIRDESVSLSSDDLIARAKTAIGTPYVRGGTSTSGFDCSGFVQWAYRYVGVQLPRTAREQSVLGVAIDADEMEAGDIVAFKHPRRGYHTGIYIGDGKFIHSPRRGKSVEITSLSDPYFRSTFLGARRVDISEADAETAQRLVAMYESRAHRQKTNTDASFSSQKKSGKKASYTSSRKSHRQTVSSRNSRSQEKKSAVSNSRKKGTQVSQPSRKKHSEQKASASRSKKKEKASASSSKKNASSRNASTKKKS